MGRQDGDPAGAIVGPSIALLQERFKKLERIKEKRQMSTFSSISEAKRIIVPTNYNNDNNNSFSEDHHQMFLPSRPAAPFHQDPLSLGLNLNNKHADYRSLKSSGTTRPSFSALWSAHDKRGVKRPQKPDVSDVDTTLHL
ncbi:unnamed protein product [Coffea canephora]|uniref:Uncharacterized protein n=1 Tax=Coffea canephora TaxID=49390 RepID=A0A068VEY9_COFCA|nr:unnamed protein product [Coffea canephora]